jgi:hypothetical protein
MDDATKNILKSLAGAAAFCGVGWILTILASCIW